MRLFGLIGTFVLAAAVLTPASDARAGTTVHSVRGKVAAADTASPGPSGIFHLTDVTTNGASYQRFAILLRGLPAGEVAEPVFEVFLDNGTQTAGLGPLHLFSSGTRGWLRFDSRKDAVPEGVTSLDAFSGGTVRITMDGQDVATGSIASFVQPQGPDQGGTKPPQAIALGAGSTVLGDPHGGAPAARVTGYAVNSFFGLSQGISISAVNLAAGANYSVVLTGETSDTLGTFSMRSFFGLKFGGLVLSTKRGDAIPGGSVGALAGRGIEIRDADGSVVLSGAFPGLN